MKNFFRKGLTRLAIIAMSLFTLGGLAFASSYSTMFSFDVRLTGESRYFDGQNIAFESSYAKSYPKPHKLTKNYTVTLKRDAWGPNDKIGTVTLKRDSAGLAEWSNVGPGDYFFILEKANDGVTLKDNNVKMYNY